LFTGVTFDIQIDDNYSTNIVIVRIRSLQIVTFELKRIFNAVIIFNSPKELGSVSLVNRVIRHESDYYYFKVNSS
jgi:hypothetical protein